MKILCLALLLSGCAARPTRTWEADEVWTYMGFDSPADTARRKDAEGNPNFGPK